jgi:predicted Zn-dependent protease
MVHNGAEEREPGGADHVACAGGFRGGAGGVGSMGVAGLRSQVERYKEGICPLHDSLRGRDHDATREGGEMKVLSVVLMLFLAFGMMAQAVELPSFLPEYYSPAFAVGSKEFSFVKRVEAAGVDRCLYSMKGESLALSVEHIKCDKGQGESVLENTLFFLSKSIETNDGYFVDIKDAEIHGVVIERGMTRHVFVFALPSAVQIWTYTTPEGGDGLISGKYEQIRGFADKSRYIRALVAGNVVMGHWGLQIRRYAEQLIEAGNTEEGLVVLKKFLATSSFDYEGHVLFLKNTDDKVAGANSAGIVFSNAEDVELIDQAAEYLKKDIKALDSIPFLNADEKETGLQVVLIPLPPCNLWLLDEAAAVLKQITDIPVKKRRLKEEWVWGVPERIANERVLRSVLMKLRGQVINFRGWTKERYIQELSSAVENEGSLSRYYVEDLIRRVGEEPGQYFVDPYLDRLCEVLKSYRSGDNRTMYVGLTEVNIYSGDNNYLFSLGRQGGESRSSIMSYYMMLGKTLGEEFQSRPRLTERVAKELVPAALKQLAIERSTDPTCPYSYSSGVSRLDQKKLKLSEPVKAALEGLRDPVENAE